ncbi:glycosyltransferase family 2 protein [Paenibacillus senegalensis]|uniref:glycosyltransferase family 2 protein n=1 Tax=Paenibacillus senegalensis TaxID=1465766 RepID=UPI001F2E60BE|nr:glycosyltransferase family 2 protein [Paenibacillus senegalensis]
MSKISVIIPVMNERRTLGAVIRQVRKIGHNLEIIVVCNGSTDGSPQIARRMGAKVITFKRPLGHDVGRSIGARAASGDILLFMDGDIVIPAKRLLPFIRAIESGADIALNQYNGPVHKKKVHPVVLSKHALNVVLGRPDLQGTSLTAIPHAMSRSALNTIGAEYLAVPPKAQAIAVAKGLRVEAVHYVRVGKNNPGKRRTYSVQNLIVGDHLEAIHWYLSFRETLHTEPHPDEAGGRI